MSQFSVQNICIKNRRLKYAMEDWVFGALPLPAGFRKSNHLFYREKKGEKEERKTNIYNVRCFLLINIKYARTKLIGTTK